MNILNLPEFNIIEPPQENETDMLFKVETKTPPSRCDETCVFNFHDFPPNEKDREIPALVFENAAPYGPCDKTD